MSLDAPAVAGPRSTGGPAKKQKTISVQDLLDARVTAFSMRSKATSPAPAGFLPSRTDSAFHPVALLRLLFKAQYYDSHLRDVLVNKALNRKFHKSGVTMGTAGTWKDQVVFESARFRFSAADFDWPEVEDAVRSRVSLASVCPPLARGTARATPPTRARQ